MKIPRKIRIIIDNPVFLFFRPILFLLLFLMIIHTPANKRKINAVKHAEELELVEPKIKCDDSILECSCSISFSVNDGRDVRSFECCRDGCSAN